MGSRIPPKLLRLIQFAVLAVLAVLLWKAADGQAALRLLQNAHPSWLACAVLVLTLQTVLSAQRWRITAGRLGLWLSGSEAVREYYLAQVVNQTLPGGFVGDAGRIVRARHRAGLYISGQAVVYERVAGQMGLVAILVLGVMLSQIHRTGWVWPEWRGAYTSHLLLLLFIGPAVMIVALRLLAKRAGSVARFIASFKQAVTARDVVLPQIVLSLATALCNVAAFAICAQAIGASMPLVAMLTFVPLILFSMLIPLSVSGWGIREGAAALMFPIFGATASQGLATSVVFGLVFLVTVLPGLVVIWLRPNAPVLGRH